MNFHQRNNNEENFLKKKLFLGFVFFVVLIFIINFFTGGVIGKNISTSAEPIWKIGDDLIGIFQSVNNITTSKYVILKERDLLKERVHKLELYALNNIVLESENKELRKLFDNKNIKTRNGILARVISQGGKFPYGTIIIAGEGDTSLTINSLVFVAKDIVIGSISVTNTKNSLVTLISAPNVETQVLIGTGDKITRARLMGIGNGNMTTKIPRDIGIKIGDPVVLLAKETAIVGFVDNIEVKPTDAFQIVRVRTPINIGEIRFVRVL